MVLWPIWYLPTPYLLTLNIMDLPLWCVCMLFFFVTQGLHVSNLKQKVACFPITNQKNVSLTYSLLKNFWLKLFDAVKCNLT